MRKYIWLVFVVLTTPSLCVHADIFGLKESIFIEDNEERNKFIKLLNKSKFNYELAENGHIWYSEYSKRELKSIIEGFKLIEKKTFNLYVQKNKYIKHYRAEFEKNNMKFKEKSKEEGALFIIDEKDRATVENIRSKYWGKAVQTK